MTRAYHPDGNPDVTRSLKGRLMRHFAIDVTQMIQHRPTRQYTRGEIEAATRKSEALKQDAELRVRLTVWRALHK